MPRNKNQENLKDPPRWSFSDLVKHIQYAVDLEFWTIPFYMSAMYSIKDQSSEPFLLIKSVVNQEMLHVQLAANIYNSYAKGPNGKEVAPLEFKVLPYEGETIPHLDFKIDTPDPREIYCPFSAEIGPLDEKRLNTMCLVEYPEWQVGHTPRLESTIQSYGSIGEFYKAVEFGAGQFKNCIVGGNNQVDFFRNFYNNFSRQTVTNHRADGLKQILNLIWAILSQGEGQNQGDKDIPKKYQNTADEYQPGWTHFRKFTKIRELLKCNNLPETYKGEPNHARDSPGDNAQKKLIENVGIFRDTMEKQFNGGEPENFGAQMATIGGNILTCWQNEAIPKFS